jgi:hypothetical protein
VPQAEALHAGLCGVEDPLVGGMVGALHN